MSSVWSRHEQRVEQWCLQRPMVVGRRGVVAAQHMTAAQVGGAILAQGGNAIDAAVATALALGVVEPWMAGLGGNGYLLYVPAPSAVDASPQVVNFQGVVPQGVRLADYPLASAAPPSLMGFPSVVGQRNERGYGAIIVPGAVAGLGLALERFGTRSWQSVLEPAIELAERGLWVDWHTTLQIAVAMRGLRADPAARAIFLPDDAPPPPESRLSLGNLAATLKRLAAAGPEDFYRGEVARWLAADLAHGGSTITLADLAGYTAQLLPPQRGSYRSTTLLTADESCGGGRLLDALATVEANWCPSTTIDGESYRAYAHGLNAAFERHRQRLGATGESGCTTHLSVVDGGGNMVALTFTLLNRFGSQVLLPKTGLLMNNAMGYFDPRPGYPTSLAGGRRINSSNMCPLVALDGDQPRFALGASGANLIVPAVTQIAALLIDYRLDLAAAFHAPRLTANAGQAVWVEPDSVASLSPLLAPEVALEVKPRLVFPKHYGCPSAVYRDAAARCYGMVDPWLPSAGACAGDAGGSKVASSA